MIERCLEQGLRKVRIVHGSSQNQGANHRRNRNHGFFMGLGLPPIRGLSSHQIDELLQSAGRDLANFCRLAAHLGPHGSQGATVLTTIAMFLGKIGMQQRGERIQRLLRGRCRPRGLDQGIRGGKIESLGQQGFSGIKMGIKTPMRESSFFHDVGDPRSIKAATAYRMGSHLDDAGMGGFFLTALPVHMTINICNLHWLGKPYMSKYTAPTPPRFLRLNSL